MPKTPITKPPATKADVAVTAGVIQIISGGLLFILFGIGALISKLWSLFVETSGTLSLALFLIGTVSSVFFLWKGIGNLRIAHRFQKISRIMGENTNIHLSALEKMLNWSRKDLVKTLRRQMARGFWTNAYLDTVNDVFILGYTASSFDADSGDKAVDEFFKKANDFIHQMVTMNLCVSDPVLKAKVEQLTDIAQQIFAFVKKNPEKTRQIRQFSNYYLPNTVSLLKNYQELQGETIKSENIRESLEKVAGSMTIIETAFKKQLDDLYEDKALDISVDIEVLQNMVSEQKSIK